MLRQGKNVSIAMQNVTVSKKIQLTMSKHSKKFSFRLENYNNTWTVLYANNQFLLKIG